MRDERSSEIGSESMSGSGSKRFGVGYYRGYRVIGRPASQWGGRFLLDGSV